MLRNVGSTSDAGLQAKSRRQFIPQDVTPEAALTWQTYRDRAGLLQQWRRELYRQFPESGRVLRVAMEPHGLCQGKGFAYATDKYLSDVTGLHIKSVGKALAVLEAATAD